MNRPPHRRWATAAQAVAAVALAVWRIQAPTWHPFWRDGLFLLSLYWLFCLAFLETRAWPVVTGLLMGVLGVIYLQGQMPHILDSLDLLP